MQQREIEIDHEQFEYAVSVIGKCTDDYMFFFDLSNDYYCISEQAVKRFNLKEAKFYHASEQLKEVVFPEDWTILEEELEELFKGRKTEHALEYRWISKVGRPVWINCRGQIIKGKDGKASLLVGRVTEIGTRQKADNISGCRTILQLEEDFSNAKQQNPSFSGYFIRLGIDNFRSINERYGIRAGDEIIQRLADYMKDIALDNERIYRSGGDEFTVFSWNGDEERARDFYERLCVRIEASSKELDYKSFYTCSAGIVLLGELKAPYQELCKKMEFALREAKRSGKNTCVLYNDEAYNTYIKSLEIQENLRIAVKQDCSEFELYYQPIVESVTGKLLGAEALLRWNSAVYGQMSPGVFIPILEDSGLIVPVGLWVLKNAIHQCKEFQKVVPGFKMNINLSYVQLCRGDILGTILETLQENDLDSQYIVFELTESKQLETDDRIRALLEAFAQHNLRIALDDFGTGYSNLRYLQDIKINTIKIDRSFVVKAVQSEYDYKLIKHIVDMAHNIDLTVCLEGVETEQEKETLGVLAPDYIQGFLYGRPVCLAQFYEQHIKNGH